MKIPSRVSVATIFVLIVTVIIGLAGIVKATHTVNLGLGAAENFAVLAGSTITNTGSSVINGDLGLSPGTSVTGFPPGTVNGTQYINNAAVQAQTDSKQAYTDLTLAYNDASGQVHIFTVPTELGGTTRTAGVYDSAAGTFGITGTLTLDAQGDPNAVFIFKTASTLITAGESKVNLINGAQACKVFWQVGSSATLGANSVFKGNMLVLQSATLTTNANVEGRVLARNGAVTLDANTVTKATCAPLAPAPAPAASPSVSYVPLIGITSVPEPLALPKGPGNVTYQYAVKNFLEELPLTDVRVVDDKCNPVKFITGDDNGDSKLDFSETWRYTCSTKLSQTTQSIATATGIADNTTASHQAYITVVVGSDNPPPLVSIVNTTKVAYPFQGGKITFIYKVTNPGVVALGGVTVTDDKCSAMSGKLGDTNGNNLLDINEVWVYSCAMSLKQTTTSTASVTAYANGLRAIGSATIIVKVEAPNFINVGEKLVIQPVPNFPNLGENSNLKIIVWGILSGVLAALITFLVLTRKIKSRKIQKKSK